MTLTRNLLAALLLMASLSAFAQHGHTAEKSAANPLSFAAVRNEILTDPELRDFQVETSVMTIAPGGIDTVSHRHDCELFGYVLKGRISIALTDKTPQTYSAGQMFFEKRNVLHTLTQNADPHHPAEVLLFFIIKKGRAGYTREFPDDGKH